MTDRIIELAKQAGCVSLHEDGDSTLMFTQKTLQRFAELVRAEAFEEAAKAVLDAGFKSNGVPAYEFIAKRIEGLKK